MKRCPDAAGGAVVAHGGSWMGDGAHGSGRQGTPPTAGMVTGLFIAAVTLVAGPARADAPWLVARGRVEPELRAELYGGVRTVGGGVVVPVEERSAYAAELVVSFVDRIAELRGSRLWQLTPTQAGTASVAVSMVGTVVPEGAFDLGIGPHGTLTLSLGARPFSVDLFVSSGVELFVRQDAPRFPQRLGLGLNARIGPFTLSVMARAGADLQPGRFLAARADLVAAVGWLFATRR